MFGATLIAAFSIVLLYVLWRAASARPLAQRVPRKWFVGAGFVLWGLFAVGRVWGHRGTGPMATTLEFAGMTCLGVALCCSIALLAVDLGTGFGRLLPRWAPALRGWALVAGAGLSVVALVQGLRPPAVVSYEVSLPSLPTALDGKVLVAMSDTHVGALIGERWMTARIAEAQALNPDLVVFLGDMFEGHGNDPADLPTLGHLSAPLGKWFVTGNHEFHHASGAGIDVLEKAGFRRLEDKWAEAAPGLVIAGVNDLTARHRRGLGGDPIGRALANRPPGATVLLSHTPWETERAARAGVELMLSGHTHGGQIWPFGHLLQTVYPLLAGEYSVSGMPVIVCRGTGTWGPRMRLWHRGEILRITLRALPHSSIRTPDEVRPATPLEIPARWGIPPRYGRGNAASSSRGT
jgi:predicted MPP superfamily phosphohydrolase